MFCAQQTASQYLPKFCSLIASSGVTMGVWGRAEGGGGACLPQRNTNNSHDSLHDVDIVSWGRQCTGGGGGVPYPHICVDPRYVPTCQYSRPRRGSMWEFVVCFIGAVMGGNSTVSKCAGIGRQKCCTDFINCYCDDYQSSFCTIES